MSWLLPSVIASLCGSIILVVVFAFLAGQYRERHVAIWAWGWLFHALRFAFDLSAIFGWSFSGAAPLSQLCVLVSGLCLLSGTGYFVQRPVSTMWYLLGLLGGAWVLISHQGQLLFLVQTVPVFFFYSGVSIWTGVLLLRHCPIAGAGKWITGVILILWGIHKADFPFLRPLAWFAPWGFLLGGLFSFAVALGMLLVYFQKVRQELRQGEQRFRAIADYTYDWESWLDPAGRPLWINPAVERVLGFTVAECLALPDYPLSVVVAEQRELAADLLRQLAAGEVLPALTLRLTTKQGQVIWADFSGQPIPAEGGVAQGCRLSIRDVSARVRAEEDLQRQQALLRSVLENTDNAVMALDNEYRVIFTNERYLELWGMGREFLQERPTLAEVIQEVCRLGLYPATAVDNLVTRRMEQLTTALGKTLLETPRTDGVVVEGFASRLPGFGFLLTFRDITERKRNEELMLASNAALRLLFHAAPMPILTLDGDGSISLWNRAAEQLFGWSEVAVTGQNFRFLTLPGERHGEFERLAQAAWQGGSVRAELPALRREGGRLDISLALGPLFGLDREVSDIILIVDDISQRRQMEEALRISEENYRNLVESVPVPVFVHVDGYFVYLNPAAVQLYGVASPAELLGTPLLELLEIEDRERYTHLLAKARAFPQGNLQVTLRIRRPDARELELEITFLGLDFGGQSARMGICHDVTERNRAERNLRRQAEFIQTVLDTIPTPIFYKDREGVYLGCNTAFEAYLGLPKERIVDRTVFDVAPPDLAQVYAEADRQLLVAGGSQVYESEVVYADGSRHQVLFSKAVLPQDKDRRGGLVGTMLDISERKRAEDALQESERRFKTLTHEFETLFNGIPDSITVWSPEPRLLWANRGSQEHYQRAIADLVGQSCRELCPVAEMAEDECEVRRCLQSRQPQDGLRKTRDGRQWGVKAFPLFDDQGGVMRVIRLASDVTERVLLREEAARSVHLAALGELAAGVAHEINNPTGLILLEMPMLQDVFRDCTPILEEHFNAAGEFWLGGMKYSLLREQIPCMIREMTEGAQRIKSIVDELKDFSRPADADQFAALDLNEVVRKGLSLLSSQIKKSTDRFSVDYAAELPPTRGNFQRLEQVVINLVLNACQALTSREGQVQVSLAYLPERKRNRLTVRDEGCGILPQLLSQIVDPFFTTRRETGGTGLGLSVSTRIIEEHAGMLHFDSVPGEGTLVTVELPVLTQREGI